MTDSSINFRAMTEEDFDNVISLGTEVHGEGYIDPDKAAKWFQLGLKDGTNANFVAYDNNKLVGFRLTFAANNWQTDEWCSVDKWPFLPEHVCYFKCNTVDASYRGFGIGSKLLKLSVAAAVKQGAKAGVSHLWMQSPGNSAVKYFTKCGGTLIKEHPDRWNELSALGYLCPICHDDCHCSAAEMMIRF